MGAEVDSWGDFEQRLAQFLSALAEGEVLILEIPDTSRYVQFLSWGETALHGEVSYDPSTDKGTDADRIRAVGWQEPERDRKGRSVIGSENLQVSVPPSDADRLATMTVAVLREIWAVPEPQSLHVSKLNDAGGPPVAQLQVPLTLE